MAVSAQHQALAQSASTKTGIPLDVILQLLTQYGPYFVALLQALIAAWTRPPMTAGGPKTCDPALAAHLQALCSDGCKTCCDACCAMEAAGCDPCAKP